MAQARSRADRRLTLDSIMIPKARVWLSLKVPVCVLHPVVPAAHRKSSSVSDIVRRTLLADFPDLDDETLHDTLEGITDLKQMLAEVVRSALDDEALAGGLSTRLSDMKARLERLEERAKRKRQLVLRAMADCEIPKLTEADFTASLRAARRH